MHYIYFRWMILGNKLSWICSWCDSCCHRQKRRGITTYVLSVTPIPYAWQHCASNTISTSFLTFLFGHFRTEWGSSHNQNKIGVYDSCLSGNIYQVYQVTVLIYCVWKFQGIMMFLCLVTLCYLYNCNQSPNLLIWTLWNVGNDINYSIN